MHDSKGTSVPFFFSLCSAERRDDRLLQFAVKAMQEQAFGDALLAAEYVCRRHPASAPPAILRARILAAACPELAGKAWFGAWSIAPEDPLVQDAMLQCWLQAGALATVRELGAAFLPARCKAGSEASLLALLKQAGLPRAGACWPADGAIDGLLVHLGDDEAPQVFRLRLSDGANNYDLTMPARQEARASMRFRLPCPQPQGVWSLAFAEGEAPLLQGSPVVFNAQPDTPTTPMPDPRLAPAEPAVDIIIPVYRAQAQVQACIRSVQDSLAQNRTGARIIVIDDASPEADLSTWLDREAQQGRITLLRNDWNLGFIETVNRGLRLHLQRDALLLNADTLVHGDWIDRLAAALASAPDIASVTPWSNNGEITSFPHIGKAAGMPDAAQLARIDQCAAELHRAGETHDIALPACCGFAMLMRRSVLQEIGVLDGAGLTRGYGEEVDWCLRASAAGYRHLAATAVFVAHSGTVSFGFEKILRVRQNRAVLATRYPDYYTDYHAFLRADPLLHARQKLAGRLQQTCPDWPQVAARPAGTAPSRNTLLPSALPGQAPRIAIWHHQAGAAYAARILGLARAIATHGSRLRLLVIGEISEALWHTGVVDGLPCRSPDDAQQLADATLLGLCGATTLLAEAGVPTPDGLACTRVDADFDPQRWLADVGEDASQHLPHPPLAQQRPAKLAMKAQRP